jgi:hypothetical protein
MSHNDTKEILLAILLTVLHAHHCVCTRHQVLSRENFQAVLDMFPGFKLAVEMLAKSRINTTETLQVILQTGLILALNFNCSPAPNSTPYRTYNPDFIPIAGGQQGVQQVWPVPADQVCLPRRGALEPPRRRRRRRPLSRCLGGQQLARRGEPAAGVQRHAAGTGAARGEATPLLAAAAAVVYYYRAF